MKPTHQTGNHVYDIFRRMNELLKLEDFDQVDQRLQSVDVDVVSSNVLLAYLTITATAREYLPYRTTFYATVRTRLEREHPYEVELMLKGLE